MKSLISVTPKEFKRHFGEIMDMCTELCISTDQDIVVTIPASKGASTHEEIARVVYADGGYAYVYNEALLKKYNIDINLQAKAETILAEVFEKSGLAELGRKHKKVQNMLSIILEYASKELIKLIQQS